MSSTAREDILRTARAALTRKQAGAGHEAADSSRDIAAALDAATPASPAALLAQFAEEVKALGADLLTASSTAETAEAVVGYLRSHGYNRIALTGSPVLEDLVPLLEQGGFLVERIASLPPEEGRSRLSSADAALTGADHALADTGTLVFTPHSLPDPLSATLPPCHIAVLTREQVLPHMWALFHEHPAVKDTPLFLVSGPSRTADIEKKLVLGAHGPSRMLVVVKSP